MNKGIIAYIDTTEMIPAGGGYNLPGVNLYVKCCCSSEIVVKIIMSGNSIYIPCSMVIAPSVSVYLNGSFKFDNSAYTLKALISFYEPEHFTYTVSLDDSSSDLLARINEVDLRVNARIDNTNDRVLTLERTTEQNSAAIETLRDDLETDSGRIEQIENQLTGSVIYRKVSGNPAEFIDATAGVGLKTVLVQIGPVQSGSGWTAATVKRTGRNLVNIASFSATWATHSDDIKNAINALPPGQYTFSALFTLTNADGGTGRYVGMLLLGIADSKVDTWPVGSQTGDAYRYFQTFTITENSQGACADVYVYGYGTFSSGGLGSAQISEIQIETGTLTEYEPYRGQTVTVPFGNAGTVYGGILDVTAGLLTVTHDSTGTELNVPQIYTVTSAQIAALGGYNSVFVDAGSVTVDYRAGIG